MRSSRACTCCRVERLCRPRDSRHPLLPRRMGTRSTVREIPAGEGGTEIDAFPVALDSHGRPRAKDCRNGASQLGCEPGGTFDPARGSGGGTWNRTGQLLVDVPATLGRAYSVRVMIAHSHYTTGASSGENRVVADERTLLSRAGHAVSSFEPMLVGGPSLRAAVRTVWSRPAVTAVRRTASDERPDVVHFHNLFPNLSPAVLRAASDAGVPVVMTLHNFRLSCLAATLLRDGKTCEACLGRPPWRGVAYGCYRGSRAASAVLAGSLTMHRAIGSFDRVTLFAAVSGFVRDKLVEGGLDARACASTAQLLLADAAPRWCQGRPSSCSAGSRRRRESTRFYAPGTGREGSSSRATGRSASGSLLWRLPESSSSAPSRPTAVPGLLADARALLVPSRWYEGSPRAIVEALAAGVPVIASDIGGLPEHVEDGVNGLLVEPGRRRRLGCRHRPPARRRPLARARRGRIQTLADRTSARRSRSGASRRSIARRSSSTTARRRDVAAPAVDHRRGSRGAAHHSGAGGDTPRLRGGADRAQGTVARRLARDSRACVGRRRSPRRAGRA